VRDVRLLARVSRRNRKERANPGGNGRATHWAFLELPLEAFGFASHRAGE
jgi:hypothetical protein